jgi:hypothetical protein
VAGSPFSLAETGRSLAARFFSLIHVLDKSSPIKYLDFAPLTAWPGTEIVIRAGVSAQVQGLFSLDLVHGALDDAGQIGLQSIRSIGGTTSGKQADCEGKPDQANTVSKTGGSGHCRAFLDRICPVI